MIQKLVPVVEIMNKRLELIRRSDANSMAPIGIESISLQSCHCSNGSALQPNKLLKSWVTLALFEHPVWPLNDLALTPQEGPALALFCKRTVTSAFGLEEMQQSFLCYSHHTYSTMGRLAEYHFGDINHYK